MASSKRLSRPPRARTTLARMAVNATLAGLWAAGILALLIFYLNPGVRLTMRTYWPVAAPVILFYAPASGLLWTILAGVVRLFAAFRVRIPWVGFRPFYRFLVADLCLLAVLFARNLRLVRDYLPPAMVSHLRGACSLLAVAAALLAADALWRGVTRRRLRPLAAAAAALLLTAGLFGIRERYKEERPPLSASEFEPPAPASSLLLMGLGGASPDDLFPMVADGRLPHLSALVSAGSSAPLVSPVPPRTRAAWATVLTGRSPAFHGVVSEGMFAPRTGQPRLHVAPQGVGFAALLRLGLLQASPEPVPLSGATLDGILSRSGYGVVAAGWDGLIPARPAGAPLPSLPAAVAVHAGILRTHVETARRDPEGAPLAAALEAAMAADLEVGLRLQAASMEAAGRPQAVLARFAGMERVTRVFLRYQRPDEFGNVSDDELERYGQVVPDYARFLDAWLGVLRAQAGPGARVVVVSPYGIRPVGVITRLWNAVTGVWYEGGSRTRAGPGLLLAAGPGFREGGRLERARAEDVLPTLLYLLDLPVGRDMDGQPLPRLASDAFAEAHAVSAVPSWQTVTVVGADPVW